MILSERPVGVHKFIFVSRPWIAAAAGRKSPPPAVKALLLRVRTKAAEKDARCTPHSTFSIQQEYAQMQAQYNPLIEGVQAKIDNLTTLKDLSVETQEACTGMVAANPGVPGIVEAIAATELPAMSSSGSDSSNNSLVFNCLP